MSDRPDFTSNTALNAVADTLDNLPVSINAQTLGSLAVDIAAQSAGDIDINLNTASDTVTVALGSSTVTLDVNISGSNTTVDTNISGSSTTLDTDITAQSVGSIDTIINGQIGDVDIRFASQLGNVDINFQNQTDGVESGTEFAARQGSAFTRQETFQLSGNTTTSKTLSSSFPSSPFVLEGVMLTARGAFVPGLFARFLVDASGNGFTDQQIPLQAQSGSIVLDPGLRLDSGGSVDLFADNPSSQSTLVEATGLFREL
jgi:hypothetical protein